MKEFKKILDDVRSMGRIMDYRRDDGMFGYLFTPKKYALKFIASWGGGWDHVSVSLNDRCPTWEEMAWVKDLFFEPEETVMQLHPAKSQYGNNHPYCLHLWRPQEATIPTPPVEFVGIVNGVEV